MTPAAPLSAPANGPVLRDIHLPPDPSWWPLAPGWWAIAVLIVLAVCVVAWMSWRRRRWRRRIDAVMADIEALEQCHAGQPEALAAALHQWLRRAARIYDTQAIHHRGDSWRDCLARVPVDASTLDRLMTLETAMYRPSAGVEMDGVADAVRRWLSLALKPRGVRAHV